MQPTRGFSGEVVKQVLLVDPQSGGITSYAPNNVPSWIDRIIPADSRERLPDVVGQIYSAPWFNPSGQGQQVPATDTPELVYNQVDQPVWLEPMTSNNGSDNSSTGVMLFDTKDMTGRFYPLSGLGATNNVESTFTSNPNNIRNYDVGAVQLYQIYNEPTWVATFVQKNDFGGSFQAVGIVDARHLSGANVIMASTKSEALAQYAQWLADNNVAGSAPTPTGKSVTITGQRDAHQRGDRARHDGLLDAAGWPDAHLQGGPRAQPGVAAGAAGRHGDGDLSRYAGDGGDADRLQRCEHPRRRDAEYARRDASGDRDTVGD